MTQLDFFLSVLFLSIVSVNNGFQLIPYSCNPVNIWSLLDLKPLSWLAKTFICFTPTFSWTLSVLEKLKNSIFEISIIPQTLNIDNSRTTSSKSINLDIIRKHIEYSFKNVLYRQCLFLPFLRYCCSVLPPSRTTGLRERKC